MTYIVEDELYLPYGARSHQERHGRRARAQRRAAHGAASATQNGVRALRRTCDVRSSRTTSAFAGRTTFQTRNLRPSAYVLARYP